ncbi:MAG: hypothetical protein H7Y62_00765 [Hyphomicrobium sp.]|nr:hypothetical protein [Hyphomicrobium sp.]
MHRLFALFLIALSGPAVAATNCSSTGDELLAAMKAVVESDALENATTAEACVSEAKEFRDDVAKLREINRRLEGCPNALDEAQMQVIDGVVADTEESMAGCAEVAAQKAARRKAAE